MSEQTLVRADSRWRFEVDGLIEGHIARLWDRLTSHIREQMETRRHPNGSGHEPDYEGKLRELEGQIDYLSREHRPVYINHEGPKQTWREWILTIVGGLVVIGIAGMITLLIDIKADQRATLARLEEHDKRLEKLETRVYRGAP